MQTLSLFPDTAKKKVASNCNDYILPLFLIELTELAPGILTQLGPESIASLRKIAEAYQAHVAAGKGPEDIPELVENLSLEEEDEKANA